MNTSSYRVPPAKQVSASARGDASTCCADAISEESARSRSSSRIKVVSARSLSMREAALHAAAFEDRDLVLLKNMLDMLTAFVSLCDRWMGKDPDVHEHQDPESPAA